jgi:hypothetical protein
MQRHLALGISFDLPSAWTERAIVFREADVALTIARESLRSGESPKAFLDRRLAEIAATSRSFEPLDAGETKVAGAPAVFARYAARGPNGPFVHGLTLVARGNREAVLFATSAPLAVARRARELFERVIASVQLDDDEPVTVRTPSPLIRATVRLQ